MAMRFRLCIAFYACFVAFGFSSCKGSRIAASSHVAASRAGQHIAGHHRETLSRRGLGSSHLQGINSLDERSEQDLIRLYAESTINHQVYAAHKRHHAERLARKGITVHSLPEEEREMMLLSSRTHPRTKHALVGWTQASKQASEATTTIGRIEEAMRKKGIAVPHASSPSPEQAMIPVTDFRLRRQESGDRGGLTEHERHHNTVAFPIEDPLLSRAKSLEGSHLRPSWSEPIPVRDFRGLNLESQSSRSKQHELDSAMEE